MKAGWKTVKLDEVCEIVKGRKPTLRAAPAKGDLPYLVARFIRGLEAPEYGSPSERGVVTLTEADTVIICDGSNSGEIFTGLNGIMSSTMGKVVKKTEIYDPYLRHFLSSTFELFNGTKTGSAIPHLDKDAFRKLEIPLPPLAEQKRIVALLDEAFAGIEEAKAKAEGRLANSHALFVEYLRFIFEQNPNWSEDLLGDVCEFENGDRGPNYPNRNEYVKSGIPWINAGHIQSDGKLSKTEMNFITLDKFQELRSGKIKPGDLVYCLRGAIGKTAVVEPLVEGAIASSLVIIRPSSKIDPLFLYFFLISPIGQSISKNLKMVLLNQTLEPKV